jgi:outer membrane receptor protein involved in Fe transport
VAFITCGVGLLLLAVVVRAGETASDPSDGQVRPNRAGAAAESNATVGADGTIIKLERAPLRSATPVTPIARKIVKPDGSIIQVLNTSDILPPPKGPTLGTTIGADGTLIRVEKSSATSRQPSLRSILGPDGKIIQVQAGSETPEVTPEVTAPTAPAAAVQQTASLAPAAPSARAEAAGAGTASVSGGEAQVRPSSDAGDLLAKSTASSAAEVAHRSPIVSDVRIRGYGVTQLATLADGAYWIPSRRDLDTIVSKIDSSMIQDIIVIKGPYASRYGVGFAFLDIETLGAQRYVNGYEAHGSTALGYKTNGEQFRGQQAFWGGDHDYGFRLTYDLATGNDYETGSDAHMPSSYNSQNIDFAFGYWFSDDSRLQLKIMRVDQHDVELPGQVFDVNKLISDSYAGRYILENQPFFSKLVFDAWYNETRLTGDNTRGGKRTQIPELNLTYLPSSDNTLPRNSDGTVNGLGFVGFTEGDTTSTGFREMTTWGKDKCPQISLGFDLRYISQKINEFDTATGFQSGWYGIPRSHVTDPGIFVDSSLPVSERFKLKAGGRFDFQSVNLDHYPLETQLTQAIVNAFPPNARYARDYDLGAAFLTAEYKVTKAVTAVANAGYAMRAPTLTELYAFDPLISVVQNGLNSVRGNPNLSIEKDMQFDFGVRGDFGWFRGGITAFYALIHDYITYDTLGTSGNPFGFILPDPTNTSNLSGRFAGVALGFVNTPRATLSGGELNFDFDLNDYVTPFAAMSYINGRDLTRNQHSPANVGSGIQQPPPVLKAKEPLPGIAPLEARVGVRFHEPRAQPRYGLEISARMVAAQDQVATTLFEEATPGFTVWDLRAYWQVRDYLLLTAGVENFGDKNYQEHLDLRTGTGALGQFGVFQPGVSFYFGAKVTY